MYNSKIENLLQINNITRSSFEEKAYYTMLLGVFETICKEITKQNLKVHEKEKFRTSPNKLLATKHLVSKYVGCKLSEDEYFYLMNLFIAFFNKDNIRKIYDKKYRQNLLSKQNNKCIICNKNINISSSHLDHIVPWSYVGDELSDNYQMLCESCNAKKNNSIWYEMAMLLLKSNIS